MNLSFAIHEDALLKLEAVQILFISHTLRDNDRVLHKLSMGDHECGWIGPIID